MGNIITFTTQQVLGLDQKVLAQKKKGEEKKMVVHPARTICRGKGLYSFFRRIVWFLHIHIVPAAIIYYFFYQFIDNRRGHLHRKFHFDGHFAFKDVGVGPHQAVQVQLGVNDLEAALERPHPIFFVGIVGYDIMERFVRDRNIGWLEFHLLTDLG